MSGGRYFAIALCLVLVLNAYAERIPLDGVFVYGRNATLQKQDGYVSGFRETWEIRVGDIPRNNGTGFVELRMYALQPYQPASWADADLLIQASAPLDIDVNAWGNNNINLNLTRVEFGILADHVNISVQGTAWTNTTGGFAMKACVGGCQDTCPEDCSNNGFCHIQTRSCSCSQAGTSKVADRDYNSTTCRDLKPSSAEVNWLAALFASALFLAIFIITVVGCCGIFAGLLIYCICVKRKGHVGYQAVPVVVNQGF